MEVCCSTPLELKGKPVWQVTECKIQTTASQTIEHPTTTSSVTSRPTTGGPSKPPPITKTLTIGRSTLISLIGKFYSFHITLYPLLTVIHVDNIAPLTQWYYVPWYLSSVSFLYCIIGNARGNIAKPLNHLQRPRRARRRLQTSEE